jgi:hypothetical protein
MVPTNSNVTASHPFGGLVNLIMEISSIISGIENFDLWYGASR